MMKNIFKIEKIFITVLFLIAPMFFFIHSVNAQPACDVTNINFRTTKAGGANFYEESDRPFVYLDVSTSNCLGQTVNFSLYRFQESNIPLGVAEANFYINALDDRPIVIGNSTGNQEDFTIAMRAGEENCLFAQSPDCIYFARAKLASSGDIIYTSAGTFSYDCEGSFLNTFACDDGSDWDYEQIIPLGNDLGGSNGLDIHGPGNTEGNTVITAPPAPADDPNAPSVIDLHLENPLAGSVDNLQSFLQKIVYIIVKFSIPLIAIMIVYAGFLFVSARGDSGKIEKAKTAFTYAIIGGLILLAAWLVADAIKDILLNYS